MTGQETEVFGGAAKAADIVVLARVREMIEGIRTTKMEDSSYTPEMKRGMNDALSGLAQVIQSWSDLL